MRRGRRDDDGDGELSESVTVSCLSPWRRRRSCGGRMSRGRWDDDGDGELTESLEEEEELWRQDE